MSYILEALKRAERERRAGKPSLLDEVTGPAPAVSTPGWRRWLPAAAISALVAAAITYLLLAHHGQAVSTAQAPTASTSTNVAAIGTAPPSAPPAAVSAAPAAAPVPNTKGTAAPSNGAVEDGGHIASLDDLDDKPGPERPTTARRSHPSQAEGAIQTRSPTSGPASALPPDQTPSTQAPAADSATATEAQAQALHQMPDAYRAGFPSFTINVHAYSDDPAQRFVLIDGKRYNENDALPQGPRIVAIVPEGVVFDWNGERVLYPIDH